MKYLISLLALMFFAPAFAQQTCSTPAHLDPITAPLDADPLDGDYCVNVYVEVDNDIVVERGGIGPATAFIDGLLGEVATLYRADGIDVNFLTVYWEEESPYSSASSGGMLTQFREYRTANGGHNGDVAMLLSYQASGGIAYVDVICRNTFGYAFSSIRNNYERYPTYSWSVEVIAHELGHNLGSPHTQSCSWPGGAIDNCYPPEGNCADVGYPDAGTIMSYCHLRSEVGIDFRLGFGPMPLALMKNKIAKAHCVDCENGGDEPEPESCKENQVIVEVLPDEYATDLSWDIANVQDGTIVARSAPYLRTDRGLVVADTVCLPNGCYTFTMRDAYGDGMGGYGDCLEGMYVVNGPNGELSSGSEFASSQFTNFCLGNVSSDCLEVAPDSLESYANQNRRGSYSVTDGELVLRGNNWLAQAIDYTLTPQTVLKGQVMRGDTGEIHGIGIVGQIESLNPSNVVRFGGTQRWGLHIDYIPANEWVDIEIPIGQLIPNTEYGYVLFVNDFDRTEGHGDAVTGFRNLELCEIGSGIEARAQVQGMAKDEDWGGQESRIGGINERTMSKPYPNPVTDTLELPTKGVWFLYRSDGPMIDTGFGNKVNFNLLPIGIYFLYFEGETHKITKT